MRSTRQINHIGVFQTSKVFAMITFAMMVVWLIAGAIIGLFTGEFPAGEFGNFLLGAIVFLVIFPILAFIGHAIMFWFYNFVARWVGGIEFELKDVE